ncbi:hypothetical protein MCP_1471 [Methanocella paludicola SANAE]|uniref:Uncharacterized protein n=1 Tax=Methanocella paludicola (strain DSM 17711 / JCM 13418 / NBRC 101707 / SANAE) TaxID=304371 RepID=D1YYM1_METPS|nr:hypothetical protein [Methanocella paludicola]BAI61543.1 hypothetical protein MCP_1471 [Methanocella paludicola SANAE]
MKGIAIDELIALNSKRHIETIMKKAPVQIENAIMEQDFGFDEVALIKDIELDFAMRAEDLLETLQLSHLITAPKK